MRTEYPRPQFQRDSWINLNGFWEFEFDYDNLGLKEKWYECDKNFSNEIEVPYVYQSEKGGFSEKKESEVVWYKRSIIIDDISKKTILNFGAVDYETDLYINGKYVGKHIGGHTSFSFDITNFVVKGKNQITVRARDYFTNEWIPRGKQFWEEKPRKIWYTNTTGIWQTVWIEQVSKNYLEKVFITPDLDNHSVHFKPIVNNLIDDMYLNIKITYKNELVQDNTVYLKSNRSTFEFDVLEGMTMNGIHHGSGRTWSPENPNLFDVTFSLYVDNDLIDRVESYFGLRKIHVENGQVYLNNRPYYQKLALDQGYWPRTLMTAETDDDFIKDIEIAKEMGLNGVRKHQKVEDPRFLYHADKLGFLVWGECASAASFDEHGVGLLLNEWDEIIQRDYNHPSIIAWTPLNESWGVSEINFNKKQQHFAQSIYHFVKSQDQTRLAVVNDGWEMIETDLIGIHNYSHGEEGDLLTNLQFEKDLSTTESLINSLHVGKNVIVKGFEYENQPILLTEFGGISYNPEFVDEEAWGYTTTNSAESFLKSYKRIMQVVYNSEAINGFCYTQLTDVFQETNGYVTFDRKPKVPLEKIREINDMRY